jgi:hypothetical protein
MDRKSDNPFHTAANTERILSFPLFLHSLEAQETMKKWPDFQGRAVIVSCASYFFAIVQGY